MRAYYNNPHAWRWACLHIVMMIAWMILGVALENELLVFAVGWSAFFAGMSTWEAVENVRRERIAEFEKKRRRTHCETLIRPNGETSTVDAPHLVAAVEQGKDWLDGMLA